MFLVLNRLRGEFSFFAKVNALLIAFIVLALYENLTLSLICGLGYLLGESFGWGVWVGALVSHSGYKDEKENKLIEAIASKFYNPRTQWLAYCRLCLFMRGLLWWLPVFLPLVFVGSYIAPALALFLAASFPLACELGYRTKWTLKFKAFEVNSAWGRQEVYYGAMQDTAFIALILIA